MVFQVKKFYSLLCPIVFSPVDQPLTHKIIFLISFTFRSFLSQEYQVLNLCMSPHQKKFMIYYHVEMVVVQHPRQTWTVRLCFQKMIVFGLSLPWNIFIYTCQYLTYIYFTYLMDTLFFYFFYTCQYLTYIYSLFSLEYTLFFTFFFWKTQNKVQEVMLSLY